MALILPMSQAASFAHVIIDEHEIHDHGHSHQSDFYHSEGDSQELDSSLVASAQQKPVGESDHSSDPEHHTATDHLEFSKIWKPSPQIFNAPIFVVLLVRVETLCIIPQGINWPRDDKHYWQSLYSGPPPQLRAPPTVS